VCLYLLLNCLLLFSSQIFLHAIYNANITYTCVVWDASMYRKYKMAADFKYDAGDKVHTALQRVQIRC